MARKLEVQIVGDSRQLERAFDRSTKSAKQFNSQVTRMGKGNVFGGLTRTLAGAGAGIGVTAAIKSSISAASDLEQQIGKTDVVFGNSAKEVEAWSKTLATAFGLSQREALTTASDLGALFAPIGLTGAAAAEQSKKLTELGADLASFYNTDVASALDAIRSGLVGESEPLRRYGVLLSETRVQQQAMADTGKKNAKSLTDQEKVLARIKIIYQDTATAQGDFSRTSDQAAQQLKIFQANSENLKAELGQGLVPALAGGVSALNDFFAAAKGPEGGREPWWARSQLQNLQDLREKVLGDRAARHPLFLTEGHPDIPDFPLTPEPFTQATEIARRTAQAARELAKATDEVSKERRRANEAFRQMVQDRAAFAVERAGATKTLADDLAALNRYNALLARRIKGGHKTLELERDQFQVTQEIADLLRQQAEARAEARQARQFRLLGFGPTGEDLVPGVKGLKRQLDAVRKAVEGSFLDTRKSRSILAHIRTVLSGSLGKVSSEVRAKIAEMLADFKRQLKDAQKDVSGFHKFAPGILGSLTGLSPEQRRIMQRILPQLGPGGTLPTPSGQFQGAGVVTIQGGIHLHGVQNVKQLENELARRRRQRARSRRGSR